MRPARFRWKKPSPRIYRSHQAIVVGDEMQLPPTTFLHHGAGGDEDAVLVLEEGERIEYRPGFSNSFLTQSAANLPSTMLAWHYRSRYESLISFSNAAFYSGNLFTIPDRRLCREIQPPIAATSNDLSDAGIDALLDRSISFHFIENGIYENRRNPAEATHVAQLVRALLARETGLSIGIVAFSEAQQGEIEEALASSARKTATSRRDWKPNTNARRTINSAGCSSRTSRTSRATSVTSSS